MPERHFSNVALASMVHLAAEDFYAGKAVIAWTDVGSMLAALEDRTESEGYSLVHRQKQILGRSKHTGT